MKRKYEKPLSVNMGETLMQANGVCALGSVAQGVVDGTHCSPYGGIATGTGCQPFGDFQSAAPTGCSLGNSPKNWNCATGQFFTA